MCVFVCVCMCMFVCESVNVCVRVGMGGFLCVVVVLLHLPLESLNNKQIRETLVRQSKASELRKDERVRVLMSVTVKLVIR